MRLEDMTGTEAASLNSPSADAAVKNRLDMRPIVLYNTKERSVTITSEEIHYG